MFYMTPQSRPIGQKITLVRTLRRDWLGSAWASVSFTLYWFATVTSLTDSASKPRASGKLRTKSVLMFFSDVEADDHFATFEKGTKREQS